MGVICCVLFASFYVIGYEFYDGGLDVGQEEFVDECVVVDGVECFRHV